MAVRVMLFKIHQDFFFSKSKPCLVIFTLRIYPDGGHPRPRDEQNIGGGSSAVAHPDHA